MPLSLDRYKKRKDTTARRSGGGDFWRPEEGKNIIRVYSFEHELNEDDFALGRYEKEEAEVGDKVEDIDVYCPIHFVSGKPYNCEGASCDICSDFRKTNDKGLKARERYYINAVVLTEGGKNVKDKDLAIKISSLAKGVYNDILSYVSDDDYGAGVLGDLGRDFVIEFDPNAQGSDMYSVRIRDKDKCDDLADFEFKAIDLYNLDQLKPGHSPAKDDEEKSEKPTSSKKRKPPTKEKEKEPEPEPEQSTKRKPRKFGKDDAPKKNQFEMKEVLAFDDSEMGTVTGELTGIEEDSKGKPIYILTDKDGQEVEASEEELYRPQDKEEKKKEEKPNRRRRKR